MTNENNITVSELNLDHEYAQHLESELEFIHVELANEKLKLMKESAEEKAKLIHEIATLKAENHRLVVLNRVMSDRLRQLKRQTKLNVISE
jgi:hypothetical protein